MVDIPAVAHINGRAMEMRNGRAAPPAPESRADTRWLSYDELAEMSGLSRDRIVRTARQRKWAKREGNVPGEMRFAVPTSMIVDLQAQRPGMQEARDGQPGSPPVLGAIYQKFMHLDEREDRLEGYLREQMEREYRRADAAESALAKAERRLEKYTQALEATQVAVTARAAAEAALAAATHRLALMQAAAETSRTEAARAEQARAEQAGAEQAGTEQLAAFREEARLAGERMQALLGERQQAQAAMVEATRQHERSVADAAAERAALEAMLMQERIRSETYLGQVQTAAVVAQTLEARCQTAEGALLAAADELAQARAVAQAERDHIQLVLTERVSVAEAALVAANQGYRALQDEAETTRIATEAALSAYSTEANALRAMAQQAAEGRSGVEAAMAALDARFIAVQNAADAERAHIAAGYAAQLEEAEGRLQQARLEASRMEAERAAEAASLQEQARSANEALEALEARLAAAQAAAEAEGAQVAARHSAELEEAGLRLQQVQLDANRREAERAAEAAALQEQARSANEAAQAATLTQTQAVATLSALAHQVQAAEAAAALERAQISALLEEEREKAGKALAALAESDLRGDRAVGQLEAERTRVKQALERASTLEAQLLTWKKTQSAGLLTRLLAAVRAKPVQPAKA